MLRIALIGHDTRNANLGVGALTVSEIEIIRRIALECEIEIEISVIIGRSTRQSCVAGADIVERIVRPLRKPWNFFSVIRTCDLVIDISGGDSFTDIYGGRRIFQDLLQKKMVFLSNRPLVLAPQTIGPFRKAVWRALAARSLKRAAVIATRDDKSTAFLRDMGVARDVIEASDVALRLPYTPPGSRSGGQTRVGLNVSGLLMNGGYSRKNMFGLSVDYPDLIRRTIESFLNHEDGCEVHLLGHVIPTQRGGVEDDYQACLDLAEEFPQTIIAPAFKTPSEAKNYIAGMDFFAGARMHACIAAFSTGVPVVPMAYSRKFSGLFGSLGYNHTVDCTSEATESCVERILQCYEKREELAEEVSRARKMGFERLGAYEEALRALILRFRQETE